jgi:hypothetical protein
MIYVFAQGLEYFAIQSKLACQARHDDFVLIHSWYATHRMRVWACFGEMARRETRQKWMPVDP